jgi:hypothetical protein
VLDRNLFDRLRRMHTPSHADEMLDLIEENQKAREKSDPSKKEWTLLRIEGQLLQLQYETQVLAEAMLCAYMQNVEIMEMQVAQQKDIDMLKMALQIKYRNDALPPAAGIPHPSSDHPVLPGTEATGQ